MTNWRRSGRGCHGFELIRITISRPTRARRPSPICSKDARSSSYITSCSALSTKAVCPACSAIADGFNGFAMHLEHHDVAMIAVSRAPIAALQAYKRRMSWTFTWASSLDSDFNYDFNTSFTEEQERSGNMYDNYHKGGITSGSEAGSEASQDRRQDDLAQTPQVFAEMTGTDVSTYTREAPGMSAFALSDGVVYHTYSAYARGLDALWGMYQWLDRAPKGRNETGPWFKRHDQYTRDSR